MTAAVCHVAELHRRFSAQRLGAICSMPMAEIVTFDTVSAAKSANALLAVYIGGAGGFFGPILGWSSTI